MSAELIDLLRRLGETHRPTVKRDPEAFAEQYRVQCRACDGSAWRIWQPGDAPVECEYWRDYNALWMGS